MTLSVAVPVPKVALCAPAATPTLNSISWPVLLKKLPTPPWSWKTVLVSLSPVNPAPVAQVVSTPRQSANTKSPAFAVVSPLTVATPPAAGVVLYWAVPSSVAIVPV